MFIDIYRQLCDEKGLSVYKATTAIGLNRSAVAKWKNGAVPNGETLQKMSEFFGVSIGYLLGEEEKAPPVNGDAEWVEIMNRPEFRQLFHAMRNSSPEEILAIATAWNARKHRGDND